MATAVSTSEPPQAITENQRSPSNVKALAEKRLVFINPSSTISRTLATAVEIACLRP